MLANPRALFCSEAVARACRAARYPGFDRDPETTTPQDLFAFFAATGAWDPVESPATGIAVGVLCVLWAMHGYAVHRPHQDSERDPAHRHARARRGF